jgi:RNA polymerase sigma-70 factor, ECF subfamily
MTVVRKTGPDGDAVTPRKEPAAEGAEARTRRAQEAVAAARDRARTQNEARARDRARDQELVEKARGGDGRAFRALVELHQSRLFAVAFGMLRDRDDAMDVVQDAFIKAHRKLAEFEGNAAFSTWLYRICVNLCIDRKRADARRRKVDLDDALATGLGDDDTLYAEAEIGGRLSGTNPLKNSSDKELGAELGRAMAGLSEDHRSILLLREVEGMSYEEIAETLGIPRGTVMSRLFHARKNMQRLLRPFLGLPDGAGLTRGEGADPGDPAPEKAGAAGASGEESGGAGRPSSGRGK